MTIRHIKRLIALAIFAAATSAQASVVDFQVASCYDSVCSNVQGYNFTFKASGWGVSSDNNSYFNQNGTGGILGARGGNPTTVTMTSASGSTFNLGSLDAAIGYSDFVGASNLVLTGSLATGGTVTQTLVFDKVWANYTVSGFQNLTKLVFTAGNSTAGFGIDNLNSAISATNLPEPGTVSLLGLAAAAIAVARRRRRAA